MNKTINFILREYESCTICPKKCGVNRLKNEKGVCGVGRDSKVFNTTVLVNENEEIAPTYAIYFAGCDLDCLFCSVKKENNTIKAQIDTGLLNTGLTQDKNFIEVNEKFMEKVKREIAEIKPKTISFIGGEPSVHLLTIFELIDKLKPELPLVFYTNMYFQPRISRIINELFEYIIADIHFGNNECAERIAKGTEFFETVTKNIIQLKNKIILRHLLLPGHIDCCYKKIVDWIATEIPDKKMYLLTNYYPYVNIYHTRLSQDEKNAGLSRRVNADEVAEAVDYAKNKGIIIKMLDLLKPRPDMNDTYTLNQEIIIDEDGVVAFKYLDGSALEMAHNLTFCDCGYNKEPNRDPSATPQGDTTKICHSESTPITNRQDKESQFEIASLPKKIASRNDKSKKDIPC